MLPHGARSRYLAGRFYCGRSGPAGDRLWRRSGAHARPLIQPDCL